MSQLFKQLSADMSSVVSATFGTTCIYTDNVEVEHADVLIIIDRNAAVKDAIGNVIGYEVVANVEKAYIAKRPSNTEFFIDDEGNKFIVGQVREETASKWYFTVTER